MKTTGKNAQNKRDEKKQTNIKWNSRLFFQLGIVLSLLVVFFIMQTDFKIKTYQATSTTSHSLEEPPMFDYVIDVDKPKPIEPIKKVPQKREPIKRVVKSTTFDVKPNTDPTIETPIAPTDGPVVEAPQEPVTVEPNSGSDKPRILASVEFVPVFPGCEVLNTNKEKVDCMSSKINSFINKNFKKELLEDLKPNEDYRIYVSFKIDLNGYVTDVVANSRNANLKNEAQRVIKKLPAMKPGKQGDKNVEVLYNLPIIFNIQ
ncbi:energy transducer TonB [Aequorivita lipolytica]|uniref:TonB C-terminal domain-containing protein n=1 Tax=Aequorivita lipolytica TaxID=153267 RepID=A0A5C6YT69_9FLAO|nr:energy transducer TonB [Aequorivita lipolytica]TXD70652.1 hypothetical protein ESV24_00735 [Aequorivita lipolytica]SRX49687.1 hypothetical protein AEQU2_00150 [Aequorivita lipolytica]